MNFDDYGDETKPAAPTSTEGVVDWEDVGKGVAGGTGRGVTGLLGTGGTLGELGRAGLSRLGIPDSYLDAGSKVLSKVPVASLLTGPSGADFQKSAESVTGKFYEPHSKLGQYASTIAEFAPGAFIPGGGGVTARAFNTVVPAIASETAGQATKGTALEPWARGITSLGAGVATARAVTPAPAPSPRYAAAVAALDREGIPLTAGQRTGSKAVQWAETTAGDMPLSSGAWQARQQNQAQAYDRAITNRTFDPAELQRRGVAPEATLPGRDVMEHGRQSLSDEYTRLSQNNALRSDPQLLHDLQAARTNYERLALPSQRAGGARDVDAIFQDVVDNLVAGRGAMPGDVYQATRSRLGTLAKGAENTDPYLAGALRDTRGALDRGMQRGLSPEDAAAWADTNRRWANMKAVTPAVATAGDNLSPAKVAQAISARRAEQYARGAGNMDELADAGRMVLKPLPNSGTAQRTGWQNLFNVGNLASVGGGGALSMFGPLGIAAGIAAPHIASRLIVSNAGQRYLANQAVPQNNRDLISQLLVQQAASQPSGIKRNEQERAAYNRKRDEDLRKRGLK